MQNFFSFIFLYQKRYRQPVSFQVGVTGFEPATSRPPAERATKLRHTPFFHNAISVYHNFVIFQTYFFNCMIPFPAYPRQFYTY